MQIEPSSQRYGSYVSEDDNHGGFNVLSHILQRRGLMNILSDGSFISISVSLWLIGPLRKPSATRRLNSDTSAVSELLLSGGLNLIEARRERRGFH